MWENQYSARSQQNNPFTTCSPQSNQRGVQTEEVNTDSIFKAKPRHIDFESNSQGNIKQEFNEILKFVRSFNPQTSSKISQLKYTLGISSDSTSYPDDIDQLAKQLSIEIRELINSYESRLKASSQMGQRINQSAQLALQQDRECMREQLQQQFESVNSKLVDEQVQIALKEMKIQYKNKLNQKKQQQKTKIENFKFQIEKKHLKQIQELEIQMSQNFQIQLEEQIQEVQQQQLEEHVQEMEHMQNSIDLLQQQMVDATNLAEKSMESKYQQRLELVRKIHDEEMQELRRANEIKERELEEMAINLIRDKQQLIEKCKKEAADLEKKKRAKFQAKIETIKNKEIADFKKQFLLINSEIKPLDQSLSFSLPLQSSQMPLQSSQSRMQKMKEQLLGSRLLSKSSERNLPLQQSHMMIFSQEVGDENTNISQMIKDSTFSFDQLKTESEAISLPKQTELKTETQKVTSKFSKSQNDSLKKATYQQEKSSKIPIVQIHLQSNKQQCEQIEYFEIFDYRVCQRCGLNDKKAPGICRYHPSKIEQNKFSSDYHVCLEQCKQSNQLGCKRYQTHLYQYGKQSRSQPRTQILVTNKVRCSVSTMTEVTLKMIRNKKNKERATTQTPRVDELMRRSNMSSLSSQSTQQHLGSYNIKKQSSSPGVKSCLKQQIQSPIKVERHPKFNLEDLASSVGSMMESKYLK